MGACPCKCFKKKVINPITPVKISPKIIVESKYGLQDIKVSENTPPRNQSDFLKYSCPICLKYYSTILASACCKNYICHFCVNELQMSSHHTDVTCPECRAYPYRVVDVNPHDEIKIYSDSYKDKWLVVDPNEESKEDLSMKFKTN